MDGNGTGLGGDDLISIPTSLFFSIPKFVIFKKLNKTRQFGGDEKILKPAPFTFDFYFYFLFFLYLFYYYIKINIFHKK